MTTLAVPFPDMPADVRWVYRASGRDELAEKTLIVKQPIRRQKVLSFQATKSDYGVNCYAAWSAMASSHIASFRFSLSWIRKHILFQSVDP